VVGSDISGGIWTPDQNWTWGPGASFASLGFNIGTYTVSDALTSESITIQVVPEPATFGLMGFSTLGLLFRRRRSRTCLLTGVVAHRGSVELASTKKDESSVGYVNTIKPYMDSKRRAKAHAETKWVSY
jgi:hypothetical protein